MVERDRSGCDQRPAAPHQIVPDVVRESNPEQGVCAQNLVVDVFCIILLEGLWLRLLDDSLIDIFIYLILKDAELGNILLQVDFKFEYFVCELLLFVQVAALLVLRAFL